MTDMSAETARGDLPGEWYQHVPRSIRKHVVAGSLLLISTFGGFSLWAFQAPLAAAVVAQGSFVATGENKIVQHFEGGIISEILVQEGDLVAEGDVLLRLDNTVAETSNRELHLRQIRLETTEARLLAEHLRHDNPVFPPHVEALRNDPEVAVILDSQRTAFDVTKSGLQNDLAIIERNIDALGFRETGYTIQREALNDQITLLQEELESLEELLERGLVRRTEVLALRRARLEGLGQIARLDAELGEIAESRSRLANQRSRTLDEYSRHSLGHLQVVQSELESVREQLRRSQNILTRTEVTAPASGAIIRLHYHTTGGVIETGRAIAEILPVDAPLIIEAMVARTDIDTIEPDQPAIIRMTALNQRTTPVLNGRVDYVSADAVASGPDRMAREVYIIRVSIPPEELSRIRGFTPTPGMPAEVMVQTAERTFVQYIIKPISDSMSRAFREQ